MRVWCKIVVGKSDRLLQPKQVHCTFDDFVGWAAPQIIFSVRRNSDPERLASFQTVETVLRSSDVLPSVVPRYCHVRIDTHEIRV